MEAKANETGHRMTNSAEAPPSIPKIPKAKDVEVSVTRIDITIGNAIRLWTLLIISGAIAVVTLGIAIAGVRILLTLAGVDVAALIR